MTSPYSLNADEQYLSDLGSGLGIYSGAKQGGAAGDTKAVASAGTLASKTGVFGGGSSSIGNAAGDLANAAGIYSGIKQGGVVGYGSAAINAADIYARSAGMGSTIGSGLGGDILGGATAALAVYQFAENWQSGKTGADTVSGAEAGASVGTAILPGIGTAVGAVIGGVVGAVSSLFGPGAKDPENVGWDQYAAAYQRHGAAGVQGATPANNYQMLAGIFDARGSSIPFYQKYGRMGEGAFTTDMAKQINGAISSGKIQANAPPSQIYSQVVEPWINSMSPGGWQNTDTSQGAPEKAAIGNMLTNLIGQYQSGQLTSKSQVGINGQTIPGLPAFDNGASSTPQAKAAQTARTQGAANVTNNLAPAVSSFGTSGASSNSIPTALAGTAALGIGAAAAGATMANPVNPSQGQATTDPTSLAGPNGSPGIDQGVAPTSAGAAASSSSSTDPSFLSEVGSFLGSPVGTAAGMAALGGIGLAEANSQKSTNDQLAASLQTPGQPYSNLGAAELAQLQGGPSVGGALGASINQQTTAAAELGNVATSYGTGQLDPAQEQQVQDYITQQKQAVNAELAATGNTDTNSTEYQTRYQQIEDSASQMREQLIQGNTSIAEGALTAVQTTYSNLLNGALSSSEFGFSTDLAAVQTQIQSDTQLSGQLQQLFGAIAQGYGSAMGGGKGGSQGSGSSGVAKAASGVAQAAKGVASSASGGNTSPGTDSSGTGGGEGAGYVAGGGAGGTDYSPYVSSPDQSVPSQDTGTVGGSNIPTDYSGNPDFLSGMNQSTGFDMSSDPFSDSPEYF